MMRCSILKCSSHLELFHLFLCFPVTLQCCVELSFQRIHWAVKWSLTRQRNNFDINCSPLTFCNVCIDQLWRTLKYDYFAEPSTETEIRHNSPCISVQPPAHTSWYDFCAPGRLHTPDTPAPGPLHSKVSAPLCVCCSGGPEPVPSLPPRHLQGELLCCSPPDRGSNSPLCWQQCGWACNFVQGTPSCTEGMSLCLPGQDPWDQPSSPQCTPGRRCDHRAKIQAA